MEKSKILIVINNLDIGGAERLAVADVNELVKRGIKVKLLTLKREYEASFASDLKLREEDWTAIHFTGIFDVISWWKTFRFIGSYKPDLTISHLWFANMVVRVVGKVSGIKNIICFEQNVYDAVKTQKMFFIDRILQNWCTKIIAVSNAVKQSLITHGIREDIIDIVYNGVDAKPFLTLNHTKERIALDISQNTPLFLFVGRLIPQKGVDVLLKAFAKISEGVLLIAGTSGERNEYENLAKQLAIQDRVLFLGVRTDVPKLIIAADCFVLPSRYEGLPLVLVEAMAAGLAIIISDFDAGTEIITNGVDGLIVKKENVEQLAEAMTNVARDKNLRNALMIGATNRAKDFSIEHHVDAILSYITKPYAS